MRMENINVLAAQEPRQANHPNRILNAICAIATEALDPLSLHVIAQPGRHRIERSEKHSVATAIVPLGKLREKATGVAVLGKMQNALRHIDTDISLVAIYFAQREPSPN